MMQGRMLIPGGTGFIGRHLCYQAVNAGYSVTSLSLHWPSKPVPGVKYLCANFADREALLRVMPEAKFEYVVQCGGYIDHRLFKNGGRQLIDTYLAGLQNLVELVDRQCLKRFIHLGSSDEYGSTPGPQREDLREDPIAPYSLAKVAITHFLQMLWRTEQFPAVTLRLFLAYGPGQDVKRFLPQIIKGCLENKSFPVSEGRQLRDFCYIEDITRGILLALDSEHVCGEVINLASGEPVSIRSMVEKIHELVGKGAPGYGQVPFRPGENMSLYADISKARQLLNWHPAVTLSQGLLETINAYRAEAAVLQDGLDF